MNNAQLAKYYLDMAARAAARGFGHVEPNPMVGAVVVKDGEVIGVGHHRRFGSLHAERDAIASCRANGHDPAGSVVYCTLEPCSHHGKQPPCTDALIEAKVDRVVIAQRDPSHDSSGGTQVLEAAGIKVELTDQSPTATRLSDPFIHRVHTGRPWVIAKWAQTIDGRIATSIGESQWISNSRCRLRVHKLRAKVDAVMIGVGTAIADDPMLNARGVRSVRRVAKRVLLDSSGRLKEDSRLVSTARHYPTLIYTSNPTQFDSPGIQSSGCNIIESVQDGDHLDLNFVLKSLAQDHDVSTVLVEAGPRVLGSLIEQDLINEAVVYIAPGVIGDKNAQPVATGRNAPRLEGMRRFELVRTKQIESDIELVYRRQELY
jgi:diaminohydroxyphosphoribosylaminopyrimidine deaminase / 5-amino-6-(5-phosphoribosylamino)uracil reductase